MDTLKVEQLSIVDIVTNLHAKLSFCLNAGECLAISGASGLGKSMFLKAIADILPHQGEIYLDNTPCREIPAPQWRRQIMLVPAESQWWYETVSEHFIQPEQVDFGALGFNQEILQRSIHHLSSGEKQRLSILRALQYQPQVLLLDEPTANLDKQNTQVVENMIKEFVSDQKHAALWVSHDQEQIKIVSKRMLMLSKDFVEESTWE